MLLNDRQIIALCEAGMITPFEPGQVRETYDFQLAGQRRIISYGTSSFGYDIRLCPSSFRVFSPVASVVIDPKKFDERSLIEAPLRTADDGSRYWLMPPHSYALGVTVETFNIPRNVTALCVGKSTYARAGLLVNCTPLEASWSGKLVLEFSNSTNLPLCVYANEGISQCLFFWSDEECLVSYADRGGKYQHQTGITLAKV